MRLAIICDDYPSADRPVFVFVEQLVNELARQGVDIRVIAPQSLTRHLIRHVPILPKISIVDNMDCPYKVYRPYSISAGNAPACIKKILSIYNRRAIGKILELEKDNIDALYGHFWHNAYRVREFAYKYRKPLFVACGEGDNAIEDLVNRISEPERRKFSDYVTGVICVSSENKRRSIEKGLAKENAIVLPNAVDSGIFTKDITRDVRGELGVTDDDFLIAFTGAFIHRKGSDRLAAAIDKLGDPHIKVAFIGNSLEGYYAIPECKGIVHMGRVNHNEVPQYLFAADCFCLPTLNEGCSNAIVEALAAGLPVISSNLPFNEDILDETNSIKIDPMDVDQIADAIKKLKDNPALRKELSDGALGMAANLKIDKRAAAIRSFIEIKMQSI